MKLRAIPVLLCALVMADLKVSTTQKADLKVSTTGIPPTAERAYRAIAPRFDERAAMDTEIGRLQADIVRLQADNERLKAQLAEREPTVPGKIEIPLPSDRDMDRMMSFLERAWRRLIEMANRVQRDVNGKI